MGTETDDKNVGLRVNEIIKLISYERAENKVKRKDKRAFSSNWSENVSF